MPGFRPDPSALRGSPIGNPSGRPLSDNASISISVRVRPRDLACIALVLHEKGWDIRSLSSLVMTSVSALAEGLVQSGQGREIGDITEAMAILRRLGLYTKQLNSANGDTKGLASVVREMQMEDRREEHRRSSIDPRMQMKMDILRDIEEGLRSMGRPPLTEEQRAAVLEVEVPEESQGVKASIVHQPGKGESVPLEEILDEGPGEAFLEAMRRAQDAGVPPPVSDPD